MKIFTDNHHFTVDAFVISLGDTPRNSLLTDQLHLQGIIAKTVRAHDGRNLIAPFDPKLVDISRFMNTVGRMPVGPEIGCALSHLEAVRAAKLADLDYGLILEEDAAVISNLMPAIMSMRQLDTGAPTILQLFCHQDLVLRKKTITRVSNDGDLVGEFYTPPNGAVAYLVNRSAIEILAAMAIVEGLADWPPIAYSFRFLGYFPNPITTSFENSAIEQQRSSVGQQTRNKHMLLIGLKNYLNLFSYGRFREHSASLGSRRSYLRLVLLPHTLSMIRYFRTKRVLIGSNTFKIR